MTPSHRKAFMEPTGVLSELPLGSIKYLLGLLRGQEAFDFDKATDSALNLLTYLRNQFKSIFAPKAVTMASLDKFTKAKAVKSLDALAAHAEGQATAQLTVPPELIGFVLSLLQKWLLGKK